jgi:hypothetical protein
MIEQLSQIHLKSNKVTRIITCAWKITPDNWGLHYFTLFMTKSGIKGYKVRNWSINWLRVDRVTCYFDFLSPYLRANQMIFLLNLFSTRI